MARFINVSTISHSTWAEQDLGMKSVLATWEALIDQSALDQPDLILLPENFAFAGSAAPLPEKAEDIGRENGPVTRFLKRKASEHKVWIFASYPRLAGVPDRFYNSAILFDRSGSIEGIYDKTFPTIGEMQRGIIPGSGACIFQTELGCLGAGICFDLNFKELLEDYRRNNVELFCYLSAWPAGFHIPKAAFESQMHIASAVSRPRGVIVNPLGRILAVSDVHETVIQFRINLDCRVLHIDYNNAQTALPALKARYRDKVHIEVAGDEALYLLSSLHENKTADEMISEFDIETLDGYLARSRTARNRALNAGFSQSKS